MHQCHRNLLLLLLILLLELMVTPVPATHCTVRYFDPDTVGLDFAGMLEDLQAAPDGSIVLLHGKQQHDAVT